MEKFFFWSFWSNILFIFGMIGYLFMDTLDYFNFKLFNLLITNFIYILLAFIFVLNSTFQFFVLYYINKTTHRYYTMILSCIFDKIASHAYLFGAIITTINITNTHTIWTLNILGVYGFVIGATMNMMVPEIGYISIWADYLNLLGSLCYLLATLITRLSLSQIIILLGDFIYLIDSFLYMICWFEDRKWLIIQKKEYILFS